MPLKTIVAKIGDLTHLEAESMGRDCVYIGREFVVRSKEGPVTVHYRQSPYANPYHIAPDLPRAAAVDKFGAWLLDRPKLMEQARTELAGKVLLCWCKPFLCHGDLLAALANGGYHGFWQAYLKLPAREDARRPVQFHPDREDEKR